MDPKTHDELVEYAKNLFEGDGPLKLTIRNGRQGFYLWHLIPDRSGSTDVYSVLPDSCFNDKFETYNFELQRAGRCKEGRDIESVKRSLRRIKRKYTVKRESLTPFQELDNAMKSLGWDRVTSGEWHIWCLFDKENREERTLWRRPNGTFTLTLERGGEFQAVPLDETTWNVLDLVRKVQK